ncbi:MAG: uL15m family ribosomal protein [Candidatus Diapherotrites archaeon]
MVVRRGRKKIKARGQRHHGGGNKKNRRGAGCRGGRGNAGSHKHKFSKFYLVYGTKRILKAKKGGKAVNVSELEKIIAEMNAKKTLRREGGLVVIDGKEQGIAKILGRGKVKDKILLRNLSASAGAIEAIEKAGGKIEGTEGEAGETSAKGSTEDDDFEAEESGDGASAAGTDAGAEEE